MRAKRVYEFKRGRDMRSSLNVGNYPSLVNDENDQLGVAEELIRLLIGYLNVGSIIIDSGEYSDEIEIAVMVYLEGDEATDRPDTISIESRCFTEKTYPEHPKEYRLYMKYSREQEPVSNISQRVYRHEHSMDAYIDWTLKRVREGLKRIHE